jgi:hypothetical protein
MNRDEILLNIINSLVRSGNSYETVTSDLLALGLPVIEIENAINKTLLLNMNRGK